MKHARPGDRGFAQLIHSADNLRTYQITNRDGRPIATETHAGRSKPMMVTMLDPAISQG